MRRMLCRAVARDEPQENIYRAGRRSSYRCGAQNTGAFQGAWLQQLRRDPMTGNVVDDQNPHPVLPFDRPHVVRRSRRSAEFAETSDQVCNVASTWSI
jgi:hypothetical protein